MIMIRKKIFWDFAVHFDDFLEYDFDWEMRR